MLSSFLVWLGRFLALAGLFVLLILSVNFILANPGLARLELAGLELPAMRLSSVVLAAFVVGGVSGLLVSLVAVARLRLLNASFKRKLRRRDAEIKHLRKISLKGVT